MLKFRFYLDPEATPGTAAPEQETPEEATETTEETAEVSTEKQLISNLTNNGVDLDKLAEAISEAQSQRTKSVVDVGAANEEYFAGLRTLLK